MKYTLQRSLLHVTGKFILLITFSLALCIPVYGQDVPAPELVSPENGASDISLMPNLEWIEVDEAVLYEVELADNDGFSSPILDREETDETQFTVAAELDNNQTYYWRVYSIDAGGVESPPSETRNFTTESTAPDPPQLISPAPGEMDVSVTPTLQWDQVADAVSYEVELADNNGFSPPILNRESVTQTEFQVLAGLDNGQTYYWRVYAVNEEDQVSDASQPRSFTTETTTPDPPQLVSPGPGESNVSVTPTFQWDQVAEAVSYEVELADNDGFSSPILDREETAETQFTVTTELEYNETYYWRIYTIGSEGRESGPSETRSFTTVQLPAIPLTLAPGDGVEVAIDVNLEWSAVEEAENYDVQINDEEIFGEDDDLVDFAYGINETEYQPDNLEYGGNYYWRVQANNDAGPSGFTENSAFTVEAEPLDPPAAPTLASPGDGVENQPLGLELSWNVASGADSYQIQVATNPAFPDGQPLIVDENVSNGTSYNLSSLEYETTYHWRVRARNEAGASDWSSRSFTTEDEPLQEPDAPQLSSPDDEATGVSINPTFEWEAVNEADTYQLQVSENSNLSDPLVNRSGISGTSSTIDDPDLDYETTYYWRVRAANDAGNGDWSEIRGFTTQDEPLQPPSSPTLSSPGNEATGVSISPTLSWEEVDETDSYELQVSANSNFSSLVEDETGISGTSFETEDLNYETTYYWRVRARNEAGASDWSSRSFTTEDEPLQPPSAPSLSSPDNEATGVSISPTLAWEEADETDSYELQVSTNSNFSSPVVNETGISGMSFEPGDLNYETTYYWRVRARNEAGASDWSSRSFTTEDEPLQPPSAPSLSSPDNGATDVSISPTLTWEEADETDSYELQVSTNSNFSSPVVNETGISGTSFEPGDLNYETTYYWRVRARNEAGASNWVSRSFTTMVIPAPATPELDLPEEGETVSITPELSWDAAARAATYQIQIASAPGFASNSIVQNESGISGTSYDAETLSYETLYYWRVRATNNGGTSNWSEVRSFRTQDEPLQPPATPSLSSPSDEAAGISINPVLEWGSATDASSYELQVAEDNGFSSLVYEEDGISGLSRTVTTDLDYLTVYYWRVRAVNQAGESDWSAPRSFTTAELILPDAPENLVLETISGGIRLSWDEIEDDDIEEYVIYRGGSTENLSAVAKVFAGTTTFESSVSSTQFFGVTAINSSDNEGPLSNIVSFIDSSADIQEEWQLFSSPLDMELELNSTLQLFSFDKSYRIDNTLTPLNGYWIKSRDVNQFNFNGVGVDGGSIELDAGWNLIGALSDVIDVNSIQDSEGILTSAPVWGYDPETSNYVEADRLTPARGYWIYASENGTIELKLEVPEDPDGHGELGIMNSIAKAQVKKDEKEDEYEQLTFTSHGVEQHFLFSVKPLTSAQQQAHLLPPKAPAPLLDIRTPQNYRAGFGQSVAISITADSYPVTVQVDELHDSKMAYRLELHDGKNQVHLPLKPGIAQTIDREYDSIYLRRVSEEELASEFKLNQNYPNPFNPATTIEYRVAQQANVTLVVYNILGREVMTLVNETKQPGIYTARFDGSGLSSGVYMVRMVAGDFVSIQKMTLIK